MAELIAVAFGEAETDGSDFFAANQANILTTDEATFEEILVEYKKCREEDDEETLTEDDYPVGFWLLTQESLSAAHMSFDGDMGSDLAYWQANRTSKEICKRLAVKTLKATS
jgi:hypothetical protein